MTADVYDLLLVDDERWVRAALRKTIERTGLPFSVAAECADGREAWDRLTADPVPLVLADIRMPVLDGLELLKRIRREGMRTDVIVVSGYDDFDYAREALRHGAFDYWLKPVDMEEARRSLERWMEQSAVRLERLSEKSPEERSVVERVIAFVHSRQPGDVSLAQAAAHVHLSPAYLSQLFKRQTGRNFVDFVQEVRMRKAERMLADTRLRVSEIAERLGYGDVAYFTNAFKRWAGVPPSEFRKRFEQPPPD